MKAAVILILLGLFACSQEQSSESAAESQNNNTVSTNTSVNSALIHKNALTLDSHVDISLEFATDAEDPLTADIQASLEKMIAGGLDSAFFIVYVGQSERTPENYVKAQADAMTKFSAIHRMAEELYPDRIGFADSPDDVRRLVAEGKLAAMIGIENGFIIGKELASLDKYFELGARYVTLVHNGHNDLGDSAQPRKDLGDKETEHNGLSDFGVAAVHRMNELGIMVDVSHVSKQTALQAIEVSLAPVIASHSSIRAVADHPRNLDDETLDKLKQNGGVVQIVAFDSYLKIRPEYVEARTALNSLYGFEGRPQPEKLAEDVRAEYRRELNQLNQEWPPANVAALVDHIDYAVKRIGIDHVGISSDFGGGGGIVGWSNAAETPNVTEELIKRGYSPEEINKLWSGNILRVWSEVERIAATM